MLRNKNRLIRLLLAYCTIIVFGLCESLSSTATEIETAEALHGMGCELEFRFRGGFLCVNRVKAFTTTKDCFDRLPQLSRLECLEIKHVPSTMDRTHIQVLAALPNLRELELNGEFFDDDATRWVSSLTNLISLKLLYAKIGDVGLERLSTLTKLEHLELINYAPLTRRGGEAIAKFKTLHSFRFYGRWDKTALTALKEIPKLTSVTIGGDSLNDELAELRDVASLEVVSIAEATITEVTLTHLLEMKLLRSLNLQSCLIEKDAIERLKRLHVRELNFVGYRRPLNELTNAVGDYSVLELRLRR